MSIFSVLKLFGIFNMFLLHLEEFKMHFWFTFQQAYIPTIVCCALYSASKTYSRLFKGLKYLPIMWTSLDFVTFFWRNFIHYWRANWQCLKYCIFTKFSQMFTLISIHILIYQHATYDCMLRKVLWTNKFNIK